MVYVAVGGGVIYCVLCLLAYMWGCAMFFPVGLVMCCKIATPSLLITLKVFLISHMYWSCDYNINEY